MTVQNKELKTKRLPDGQSLKVYFEGGGEVPKELSGVYTSNRMAQAAIDAYLVKRDTDGSSKKTSRTK